MKPKAKRIITNTQSPVNTNAVHLGTLGVDDLDLLHDNIVFEEGFNDESTTPGGIILVESARRVHDARYRPGRVLKLGLGKLRPDGSREPMPDIAEGDMVLCDSHFGEQHTGWRIASEQWPGTDNVYIVPAEAIACKILD